MSEETRHIIYGDGVYPIIRETAKRFYLGRSLSGWAFGGRSFIEKRYKKVAPDAESAMAFYEHRKRVQTVWHEESHQREIAHGRVVAALEQRYGIERIP